MISVAQAGRLQRSAACLDAPERPDGSDGSDAPGYGREEPAKAYSASLPGFPRTQAANQAATPAPTVSVRTSNSEAVRAGVVDWWYSSVSATKRATAIVTATMELVASFVVPPSARQSRKPSTPYSKKCPICLSSSIA